MKKIYFSSLRIALVAIVALFSCATAQAGSTSNYWFYVAAKSHPSGAGKVYMEQGYSFQKEESEREYKEYVEDYLHSDYGSEYWMLHAKPAEGLKFLGWAAEVTDDAGNTSLTDILSLSNPYKPYVNAKTDSGDDDGSSGVEPWPFFPDTTFVAMFGLVNYKYLPGQGGYSPLGSVSTVNPTAGIGEQITFTATAGEASTFVKWLDDKGNEYTDNPLTLTVNGPLTVYPEFASSTVRECNFPAEGGIMIYSNDLETYINNPHESGVASIYDISYTSWEQDENGKVTKTGVITNEPNATGYQYVLRRHDGMILWGKGRFFIPQDEYKNCIDDTLSYCYNDTLGYKVEDVAKEGMRYYVLASDHKFHQVSAGFIDNDRWALAVPDSVGEKNVTIDFILEAAGETADKRYPVVNPFDLNDFTLVVDPTAINAVEATEPKTLQEIFDLGGRLVSDRQKGIVIKNGKKILNK